MSKRSRKDLVREIASEVDVLDDMLSALVELLEEKGILTQKEWENKIKSKIEKDSATSYRDIQFKES